MSNGIYEFALTLPITQGARRTALEFAQQQPTPAKADQVRLNTLAILVTQNYLQLMEVPTDLSVADSWDPVMRVCLDVADLEVPGVGRLECRPAMPNVDRCEVPAETWEDRVGYVVVQVDELSAEAQILGFVPSVNEEELLLNELRSPEELLDHLYELRQVQAASQAGTPVESALLAAGQTLTNLGNWLNTALQEGQQAIADGWQTVEHVFRSAELSPAYAFRRGGAAVRRAKRLNLGDVAIAMVIDLRSATEAQTEIRIQLHPIEPETYLPTGLEMVVTDVSGEAIIAAEATGNEDFLELQIDGTDGEEFSVRVCLNANQDIQSFVI
ncbi:MAG: DUF1822 family protein [Leptolyngbyaceae cyanobacterium bins.302]|nr:DUF1822 family protein [Leptolyngbyaceae cyanobacterium bins.302]